MSNILIPDRHLTNAILDSHRVEQTVPIVDWSGKPISAKEAEKDLEQHMNRRNFKFMLPVGAGWRYYKIKPPNSDKWFIGYVKNRPIPKGSEPVSPEKAFEMMYGEQVTQGNEARRNWSKINDQEQGYVSVAVKDKPNLPFVNMNDELQKQAVIDNAQKFKL